MKKSARRNVPLYLTRRQCRAVDQYAIETLGLPGVVLMENAGRQAVDLCCRWLQRDLSVTDIAGYRVSIVCGRGNNGGDGFVMARHLFMRGCEVHVDLVADPSKLTGDAAVNFSVIRGLKLPIHLIGDAATLAQAARRWKRSVCLVDALLGTGFEGRVREPLAAVIRAINETDVFVLSVDLPSGLDADTGRAGGVAVRANWTATFLARKVGFRRGDAHRYLGGVAVADIGVPTQWIVDRLRSDDAQGS